jgi:hypothetical protein
VSDIAASIDGALDAEMLATLRAVDDSPAYAEESSGQSAPVPESWSEYLDGPWRELVSVAGSPKSQMGVKALSAQASGGSESGALEDVDAPMLLGQIFVAGMTGCLVVRREDVDRRIFFEAGRPVYACSSSVQDRFIEMLARQGKVTPSEYQAAVRAADATGRKMGALLVEQGVLKTTELLPAIRWHFEEITLSLFDWTAGTWWIEPSVVPRAGQGRLLRHAAALVRDGLRRYYSADRLWARFGSRQNVFCMNLRGRAADVAKEAIDVPAHRGVLVLFDGVRPLDEVVRSSGLSEAVVGEIAFLFWAFGLLRPAAAAGAGGNRNRDREIECERIRARHAIAIQGDYFQVLGVSRHASLEEVRAAYEKLVRELSSGAVDIESVCELGSDLDTLREVIEEAMRVLGSDVLRRRYSQCLPSPVAV